MTGRRTAEGRPANFTDPHPYGYLYASRTVAPPRRVPLVRRSAQRDAVLEAWHRRSRDLAALPEVLSATTFSTRVIPPLDGIPRYDVLMLIRTTAPETTSAVQHSPEFQHLDADLVLAARNVKRFGETLGPLRTPGDDTVAEPGTYLFNHFAAADPARAIAVWETLTGWYASKLGVDNSTLLQPTGQAPFACVNFARLPHGPARFLLSQLVSPTFYSFVRARLSANDMRALPLLCEPYSPAAR